MDNMQTHVVVEVENTCMDPYKDSASSAKTRGCESRPHAKQGYQLRNCCKLHVAGVYRRLDDSSDTRLGFDLHILSQCQGAHASASRYNCSLAAHALVSNQCCCTTEVYM